MAARVKLFFFLIVAGGFGGLAGSMVGAAFDSNTTLFIGGFIGGVVMAPLSTWVAVRFKWIGAHQMKHTAIGAAIGFIAAATIAVNTLSTPIGALISPVLVGVGGLIGARMSAKSQRD